MREDTGGIQEISKRTRIKYGKLTTNVTHRIVVQMKQE